MNSAIAQSPTSVLVVANRANAQSVTLANYYMSKRHIPATNLLLVSWTAADNADQCSPTEYQNYFATPIWKLLNISPGIDYVVICRNLPSKVRDPATSVVFSLDSALTRNRTTQAVNPYYTKTTAFHNSSNAGMRLVTRLDGWSWADATALVDRSILAKRAGNFYLDEDIKKGYTGAYGMVNTAMRDAYYTLLGMGGGLTPKIDETTGFYAPAVPVMGYYSWGSNDSGYYLAGGEHGAFAQIKFVNGGIAETVVSTSGQWIRYVPNVSHQSQVSQLIAQGATGVKGYVAEPYTAAVAQPVLLFTNYTMGRNLAESYYSASVYVGWKDVVIGDPLCSPFGL